MTAPNIRIAAVVPAYRTKEVLYRCLDSLFASILDEGHELKVVVVDNSEGEEIARSLAGYDLTLVSPECNVGIAQGRNLGAAAAGDCDVVVFVDDDVLLAEDCLALLSRHVLTASGCGVATPKIQYGDVPDRTWAAGTMIDRATGRVSFISETQASAPYEVDVAPAVIAASRAVLEITGGFDATYFAVFEDTDFCVRAKENGFSVHCVPQALALHYTPTELLEQRKHLASRSYWVGRNRVLFIKDHGTNRVRFALMLPAYFIYYGYIAAATRSPKSFVDFILGTVRGLLFRRNTNKRPGGPRPEMLIVLLASVIAISWFRHGQLLGTGDQGIPFANPSLNLRASWSLWSPSQGGGVTPELLAATPFWALVAGLHYAGLPTWSVQALVTWTSLLIGGLSVVALSRWHSTGDRLGPSVAGILYLVGPYAAVNVYHRFLLTYLVFYAYLPLLLVMTRKAYMLHRWRYLFALIVATPFFAIAFVTPGLALVAGAAVVLDAIAVRFVVGGRSFFKFAGTAVAGLFCVNLFWIIPFGLLAGGTLGHQMATSANASSFAAVSKNLQLGFSVRGLNGYYIFTSPEMAWPYSSILFLSLLFVLPLLGFAALVLRPARSTVYISAIALGSLALVKGASAPLGGAFTYLIQHSEVAGLFRNPYERLGFLYYLALVILIAVTVSRLAAMGPNRRKWLALLGTTFTLVLAWPVVSSSVMSTPRYGSYRVTIPKAYRQLIKFSSGDSSVAERLLVAPVVQQGATYRWPSGYRGLDPLPLLDPYAVSITSGGRFSPVLSNALASFPAGIDPAAVPQLIGAKLVGVRTDLLSDDGKAETAASVTDVLRNDPSFSFLEKLGPVDLYAINRCTYPEIYGTPSAERIDTPSWNDLTTAAKKCRTIVSTSGTGAVEAATSAASLPKSSPITLTSRRLTPDAYEVRIPSGYRGWIVLSEGFDSGWSAHLSKMTPACWLSSVTCLSSAGGGLGSVGNHLIANSYANAWYVNTRAPSVLVLTFDPQSDAELAAGASLAGMGFVGAAVIVSCVGCKLRNRRIEGGRRAVFGLRRVHSRPSMKAQPRSGPHD